MDTFKSIKNQLLVLEFYGELFAFFSTTLKIIYGADFYVKCYRIYPYNFNHFRGGYGIGVE